MEYGKVITIQFRGFESINRFCNNISMLNSEVDIFAGRYIGSAKSALTVFSFDLSKPVNIGLRSNDESEIQKFTEIMGQFK